MDEEITIIDANTRNEKTKNFFIKNKKIIIITISVIILFFLSYFSYGEIKERKKIKLGNKFNLTITGLLTGKDEKKIQDLIAIINKKDQTYSPLALYYLLDNNLIGNKDTINDFFEVLINETNLEDEIKNLIIYKKGLFNSNYADEYELIQILNPIINSESIWKSHALYLMAEYFYSKNEKQKAKEFFNKIIALPNSNTSIKLDSQKRLQRDIGE